jgi:hypothetical protein
MGILIAVLSLSLIPTSNMNANIMEPIYMRN